MCEIARCAKRTRRDCVQTVLSDRDKERLLYKAHQALGRHLFVLGALLIIVILAGLTLPVAGAIIAIQHHQPWWIAGGVVLFPWLGLASALTAIARILGPEGITGIVRERHNSAAIWLIGSSHPGTGRAPDSTAT